MMNSGLRKQGRGVGLEESPQKSSVNLYSCPGHIACFLRREKTG